MNFRNKYQGADLIRLQEAARDLQAQLKGIGTIDENGKRSFTKGEGKEAHTLLAELEYVTSLIRVSRDNEPGTMPDFMAELKPSGFKGSAWPGEKRDYATLFGNKGLDDGGFDSLEDFLRAVWSGRDKRLFEKRAMQETIPSEGGFLVPSMFSSMLWADVMESTIMLEKTRVYRLQSGNSTTIPSWSIGDHSSNLYGGVTAYWKEEGGTLTESTPEVRSLTMTPHKLTILTTVTSELVNDVPDFDNDLTRVLRESISWYIDYYLLRGDGAGKPLGLLNSPAIISVSAEGAQSADTVLYQNVKNMYARMSPASRGNAVWLANPNTIPQLLEMSIEIGTGGSAYQVLNERNGSFTIFGRPVIFSEKMPTLGDANDIVFADLSQYLVAMRGDIQIAKSPDAYFTTDKLAYRVIVRVDGQHAWDEELTPAEGSTLSPIVGLAART